MGRKWMKGRVEGKNGRKRRKGEGGSGREAWKREGKKGKEDSRKGRER